MNNDQTVNVLAVSSCESDCRQLRRILRHGKWRLHVTGNCQTAKRYLTKNHIRVVICDDNLPDGSWKDVFESFKKLPNAPSLIVASPNADDSLWAAVLNLGGDDVLPKPFKQVEVIRVITVAGLELNDEPSRGALAG